MPNFKAEFVRRVLQDEAQRYHKNQGVEMQRRLRFHTGNLYNKRTEQVSADGSMDGMLTATHTIVQRFLDIKRKTRNKRTNRLRTTHYRIHNRFVYGHYYSIANRLMNEYTEETKQAIIKDLNEMQHG